MLETPLSWKLDSYRSYLNYYRRHQHGIVPPNRTFEQLEHVPSVRVTALYQPVTESHTKCTSSQTVSRVQYSIWSINDLNTPGRTFLGIPRYFSGIVT